MAFKWCIKASECSNPDHVIKLDSSLLASIKMNFSIESFSCQDLLVGEWDEELRQIAINFILQSKMEVLHSPHIKVFLTQRFKFALHLVMEATALALGSLEDNTESSSVPERATKSLIVNHLMGVHNRGQQCVLNLGYLIEIMQRMKENYGNLSIQEYADEMKLEGTFIWEQLKKEPLQAREMDKSLEQRMLWLAQRITTILLRAFNLSTDLSAESISALPHTYREELKTAGRYATELSFEFDQATNAGETTITFLSTIRDKLAALGNVIQCLTSQTKQIEMEELKKFKSEETQSSEAAS